MHNLFSPRIYIDMYALILTSIDKISSNKLSINDKLYISKIYSYISQDEIFGDKYNENMNIIKNLTIQYNKNKNDTIKNKIIKLKNVISQLNEEIYNNVISKVRIFKKYDNLIYLDNKAFSTK